MDIATQTAGDSLIVELNGRFDPTSQPELDQRLLDLTEQVANRILFNFASVNYINSAGLRVLVMVAKQMRSRGGDLGIVCLNEDVAEIFEVSGFSTIFSIFGSIDEALATL